MSASRAILIAITFIFLLPLGTQISFAETSAGGGVVDSPFAAPKEPEEKSHLFDRGPGGISSSPEPSDPADSGTQKSASGDHSSSAPAANNSKTTDPTNAGSTQKKKVSAVDKAKRDYGDTSAKDYNKALTDDLFKNFGMSGIYELASKHASTEIVYLIKRLELAEVDLAKSTSDEKEEEIFRNAIPNAELYCGTTVDRQCYERYKIETVLSIPRIKEVINTNNLTSYRLQDGASADGKSARMSKTPVFKRPAGTDKGKKDFILYEPNAKDLAARLVDPTPVDKSGALLDELTSVQLEEDYAKIKYPVDPKQFPKYETVDRNPADKKEGTTALPTEGCKGGFCEDTAAYQQFKTLIEGPNGERTALLEKDLVDQRKQVVDRVKARGGKVKIFNHSPTDADPTDRDPNLAEGSYGRRALALGRKVIIETADGEIKGTERNSLGKKMSKEEQEREEKAAQLEEEKQKFAAQSASANNFQNTSTQLQRLRSAAGNNELAGAQKKSNPEMTQEQEEEYYESAYIKSRPKGGDHAQVFVRFNPNDIDKIVQDYFGDDAKKPIQFQGPAKSKTKTD